MRSRSALSIIVGFFLAILAIGGFAPSTQAQTAHFAGVESVVASTGLSTPQQVAVDLPGNVYILDVGNSRVLKETPGANGYQESIVTATTMSSPSGVAVDKTGNVFVVDSGNNRILKETPSGNTYTESVMSITGLSSPSGIAADASGNLYICDPGNSRIVKETLTGTNYSQTTIVSPIDAGSIAVDGLGYLYVQLVDSSQVERLILSGSTYTPLSLSASLSPSTSVAVDSGGVVYILDGAKANIVRELSNGNLSYVQKNVITSAGSQWAGLAVDGNRNLYFSDPANGRVLKLALKGADFGTFAVGSTTSPISLTFAFDNVGKIASTAAVTQGIAGLDYTESGTGTCITNGPDYAYYSGDTCTLDVLFSPKGPGGRYGAAILYDGSGNALATGYVQGYGSSPQLRFPGVITKLPLSGLSGPTNMTADAAGNLYIVNFVNFPNPGNQVYKQTPSGGGYIRSTVDTNLDNPLNVRVDGAGNVYVLDQVLPEGVYDIFKYSPKPGGGYTKTTFDTAYSNANALGIDGFGNVYFADGYSNTSSVQIDMPGDGYYGSRLINANAFPEDIGVDYAGDVYISESFGLLRRETPSDGNYVLSSIANVYGTWVAVNPLGNVFLQSNGEYLEEVSPEGNSYQTTHLPSISYGGYGIAVDGASNVYFSDVFQKSVWKIDFSTPPALHFAATPLGQTSAQQTLTIENSGNAPLTFPIPDAGTNPVLPSGFTFGGLSTCPEVGSGDATPGTLNPSASCNLSVSFSPKLTTDTSGWMVVTDDALNATAPAYATQSIALAVAGVPLTPTISWNTPFSIVYGTALSAAQLNASANVAGTFSYSPGAGTVLGVGAPTLTATFTPADTVAFSSVTATVTLAVTQATPKITWPTPAAITYGTALTSTQLNASCTVAGTLTYSPAAGTVLTAGNQTLKATFTPTDTVDYTIATTTVTLTVNKATQTITFVAPSQEYYGVSPITLSATGGASGNPVVFSLVSGPGSLSGTNNHTLTITGAGTIVVAANQAGSSNYLAATQVTQSITALRPVPAALTTPAPGSTLSGTSATFTWTAGGGVSKYELRLGTTGPGSKDVYNAADVTTTSLSSPLITNIPAYGVTLHARLYSFINGVAQYNDYTYTESGSPVKAALTSPTPGSTLGTSATFGWTAGGGISKYEFRLGTTGVGSKDIYNASDKTTTALSTGVISVPAYGVTVYARIYSFTNTGASQYKDYTYTESGTPVLAVLTSPAPGSRLTGSSATFNWTAGGGVTKYEFRLGTTGPGSSDVYNAAEASTTALTTGVVSNIPLNGATLYARLYSYINGAYQHIDYTYTETLPPAPAVLTSPTPGSTLSGTSATFTWTPGGSVSYYEFRLGTTGAGSKDVYNAADVTTTALTTGVIPVPAYGVTLYARLYSTINGVTQFNDYTYMESGTPVKAVLTSPTPGTTLTGSSATFSWTAGGGVTKYQFRLGTTGAGSNNVYNSTDASTTALTTGSVTVPTTGATLYARLYSYINGAWQYTDYTYTEQ